MIVRNGGQDLARCLASAQPWVDEIVVVDTGSQDDSRRIASEYGAQLHQHDWRDDFAAARNASLDFCRGRWMVVLDADEAIDAATGKAWQHWLGECERAGRLVAARITTRNYLPAGCGKRGWRPVSEADLYALADYPPGGTSPHHGDPDDPIAPAIGFVSSHKVRIFPNRIDIRFAGRIHETVEASLVSAGIPVVEREEPVHHFGMLSDDPQKAARYTKLARLKVADDPGDAIAWAELAEMLDAGGDRTAALAAMVEACELAPKVHRYRLTAGIWHLQANDLAAAASCFGDIDESGLSTAERAESRHARAQIAIRQGQLSTAAPLLASALRLTPHDGYVWNTLGVLLLHLEKDEQARRALQRAAALLPGHPEPLANLRVLSNTIKKRPAANTRQATS